VRGEKLREEAQGEVNRSQIKGSDGSKKQKKKKKKKKKGKETATRRKEESGGRVILGARN